VGNGLAHKHSDLSAEDSPPWLPVPSRSSALGAQMPRGSAIGEGFPCGFGRGQRSSTSREIGFVKLSPTQNMTLLIRTEHPEEEYQDIARQIMAYEHLHAEQVGFVRKPQSPDADISLHMAGGEFCGNACMALAALTAADEDLDSGRRMEVVLEVSGTDGLVMCQVVRRSAEYVCELAMPVPHAVERTVLAGDVGGRSAVVRYDDSLHVVIETGRLDHVTRARAQSLATRLGETWNVSLVGVMLYDPDSNCLTPLVHVPLLGSMVWERGCGSGTASLGAYLAWKNNASVATSVIQPGGTMKVAADYARDVLTGITVEGSVRIVAEGRAYLQQAA
jgi:diaminopimelate epimerase